MKTTVLHLFAFMLLWTAAGSVSAQTVTDVLDYKSIGISGKYYKTWEKTFPSGAIYTGNSAGDKNTINLRSEKLSGIVVKTSGGIMKSITIKFHDVNVKDRQINIYGKNTPYSENTVDLYNAQRGDLIASIKTQIKDTTIYPPKNYAYIGIRSKKDLISVDQIQIEWAKSNPDIAEKGSLQKPYSVADVISGRYNNEQGVYVEGYIRGAYTDNKEISDSVNSNIIIGATADATDYIAVELPQGKLRDAINVTTGGMIGTKVILKGTINTSFFDSPGLISTNEAYVGINLTNAGYATMYFSKATLQVPKNITAFTYKMVNGKLVESKRISAGENIAAGTAVVLNGESGDYWCKVITENENNVADPNNILQGTDELSALSEDTDNYFYMLSVNADNDPKSVGFYWGQNYGAAFTNGAHKAYLKVAKRSIGANAKSFYLFSNISTAIQPAIYSTPRTNTPIHNIAGQRVNSNYKGIIIYNGKKYISK